MSTMNPMPALALRRPDSLPQALALLAATPEARVLAGGTDLVPNLRRGLGAPPVLVDVSALPELGRLEWGDPSFIGASITLARLAADAEAARRFPALVQAAQAVAGPGHRTVATVGGNLCLDTRCVHYNQSEWWRQTQGWCLKYRGDTCHVAPQGGRCHAAFSGDLAPALLALGAEVELAGRNGPNGTRRLPLAELYRDDGAAHLTLVPGEILCGVWLPAAQAGSVNGYRKARVRGSMDFPLAGVAASMRRGPGGELLELRVALTGTNSNPFVLEGTEALLGRPLDDDGLAALGKLVAKQVSPMRSTVTPSNYRRQVASALAQRLLRELGDG